MKVYVSYCRYCYKEIEVDDKFNILKHRSVLSPEEEDKLDYELMNAIDEYFDEDDELHTIYSDDDDASLLWESF